MSDRAALFAAICANPDEDTARLVFADWLDEHGEGKRAAMIRSAVEYARFKDANTDSGWVYRLLRNEFFIESKSIKWTKVDPDIGRIFELEKVVNRPRNRITAKTDNLPKLKGIDFTTDDRGFMSGVRAEDGASFVKHADAMFRAAPITEVTFTNLNEADAREIVNRGYLAQLRSICGDEMEPAALLLFGTHPDAEGVRNLEVGCGELSAAELGAALIRGKHWTGLHKLTLQDFDDSEPIEDTQVTKLFRKPVFSQLRELNAWGNSFNDAFAQAVAAGGMPELRFMDIAINSITDSGFMAIARSKGLRNLRFLDIASNDAEGGLATAAVLNSAQFPHLTVLKIGGAGMPVPDAKELAKPGRGPTLRSLEMSRQMMTVEQAAALAACPAIHGLWHLELDYANFRNPALAAFLKSPGLDQLAFLDLEGNQLTMRGAKAIANWPKATSIQWLGLSGNPLSSDGLTALADSPYLSNLKNITVSVHASSVGYKKLRKRFGKSVDRKAW